MLLPQSYAASAWPLRHVAVSADGLDIAAAGSRGLALFSRRTEHWRLFGDVYQERSFAVTQLGWVTDAVVRVGAEGRSCRHACPQSRAHACSQCLS